MTSEEFDALMSGEFTKIGEAKAVLEYLEQCNDQSDIGRERLQKTKEFANDLRKRYRSKQIHFITIEQGRLAVGGRPSLSKTEILAKLGIDIVITLLREKEGQVPELGKEIQQQGMQWIWFPLSASTLPRSTSFLQKTTILFDELQEYLKAGKTLYIHCAAGIHRTGSFANAFLQYQHYTEQESRLLVKAMREVTAREAVEKHWKWAECFRNGSLSSS